jgi:SAM-dependent methyltransferase
MASFWDDRYDQQDYVFGEAPNAFLASQVVMVRGHRKALAVADGEGRNGVWLAEQGLDVLSIDASPVGLRKARELAEQHGVPLRTELVDIADYAWPEAAFDLVAAIFIQFAAPPLREQIFAGIKRSLVRGGTLIIEGYRPEQIGYGTGGSRQVENLYTSDMLKRAFSDFEIVHIEERDAVLAEGSGHAGMSALVDLIARKK